MTKTLRRDPRASGSTMIGNKNGGDPAQGTGKGLPFAALTALVVGSMIGGGIFSLPAQTAAVAAPGPVLLGWLITGAGMLMLALTFQTLAVRRPEVDGGVYGYARSGFGDFIGFTSAWGYWVSAWVGNVAFFVLLFGSLGYFFPVFGEGTTPAAIAASSVLLWAYHCSCSVACARQRCSTSSSPRRRCCPSSCSSCSPPWRSTPISSRPTSGGAPHRSRESRSAARSTR